MKYDVWYRQVTDGRAPQFVDLQAEYRKGGVINADSRRSVEIQLSRIMEPGSRIAGSRRSIKVGDIIVEHGPTKLALIYTATGAWASVDVVTL